MIIIRSACFIFLLFASCFFADNAAAQTRFGIAAGVGTATQILKQNSPSTSFEPVNTISWQAGLSGSGYLFKSTHLGWQLGAAFIQKGAGYRQQRNPDLFLPDTSWVQPIQQAALQVSVTYRLWHGLTLLAGTEQSYRLNKIDANSVLFLNRKSQYDAAILAGLSYHFANFEVGLLASRSITPIGLYEIQDVPEEPKTFVHSFSDQYVHLRGIYYFW